MTFQFACRKWLSHKDLEPAGPETNIRLRLRFSFRLLSFGYFLKDDLLLTQPKRAAQPSNEIRSTKYYVRNYQRIMQNKPNSLNVQIFINIYDKKDYKNFISLAGYKNKPNSNPIKPNFKKDKMNVNLTLTKDYRKKDDFSVRINKPNFVKGPK